MAVARIKVNGSYGSRDDLAIGDTVTLTNGDNVGATSWLWELMYAPPDSAAVISGNTSSSATFEIDKEGPYLVRLTVNGVLQDTQYGAVRTLLLGLRQIAAGETTQADVNFGWAVPANDNVSRLEKGMRHSHRLVGKAGDSIVVGVVYANGTGSLANGDTVSTVEQASAAAAITSKNLGWAMATAEVDEPVTFITLGPTGPITGFDTTAATIGDAVYLDDDGAASLTPGTIVVVIGKVIGALAANGRFFFNPESTNTGSLASATSPQIDAGDTGVVGTSLLSARQDHQHPVNTAGSGVIAGVGTAAAGGSSATIARGDHVHPHGAHSAPTDHAVASGSANGFMSSAHFTKLEGLPDEAAGVSDNNPVSVSFNAASPGASPDASRSDHQHQMLAATPVAVGTANAEGTSDYVARADHVHKASGAQIWDEGTSIELAADSDDLDVSAATKSVALLTTDGNPYNVTGIVPGGNGQVLFIRNDDVGNTITLKNQDGGSDPANQFLLPNSADLAILPNQTVVLYYSTSLTFWVVVSMPAPDLSAFLLTTDEKAALDNANPAIDGSNTVVSEGHERLLPVARGVASTPFSSEFPTTLYSVLSSADARLTNTINQRIKETTSTLGYAIRFIRAPSSPFSEACFFQAIIDVEYGASTLVEAVLASELQTSGHTSTLAATIPISVSGSFSLDDKNFFLFDATSPLLYHSRDGGKTFSVRTTGLSGTAFMFKSSEGVLFAMDADGSKIARSSSDGLAWTNPTLATPGADPIGMIENSGKLFVYFGDTDELQVSSDSGATFSAIATGAGDGGGNGVHFLLASGSNLFAGFTGAGASNVVGVSINNGVAWNAYTSGLGTVNGLVLFNTNATPDIAAFDIGNDVSLWNGTNAFVATSCPLAADLNDAGSIPGRNWMLATGNGHTYRFTHGGSWASVDALAPTTNAKITATKFGLTVYGTDTGNVRTTIIGTTWATTVTGLAGVDRIVRAKETLVAYDGTTGVVISSDYAASWAAPLPHTPNAIDAVYISANHITYVSTGGSSTVSVGTVEGNIVVVGYGQSVILYFWTNGSVIKLVDVKTVGRAFF